MQLKVKSSQLKLLGAKSITLSLAYALNSRREATDGCAILKKSILNLSNPQTWFCKDK